MSAQDLRGSYAAGTQERGAEGGGEPTAHRRGTAATYLLVLVFVLGAAASVAGAVSWRNAAATENQRAFEATASSVADSLNQALERDANLATTARAQVALNPNINNAQFGAWFTALGSSQKFPGAFAFAYIEAVTLAQLTTFANTVENDPPQGVNLKKGFVLSPAGIRPQYCLMRLTALQVDSASRLNLSALPEIEVLFSSYLNPGSDECETGEASLLNSAASTKELTIGTFDTVLSQLVTTDPTIGPTVKNLFGTTAPIEMVLPVESIATTTSPSHLLGWVGGMFDTNDLLRGVVHDQRGMSLVLSDRGPKGQLQTLSQLGHLGPAGSVETFDLTAQGNWVLQVSGSPAGGWSPTLQGTFVLVVGLLMTALLLLLIRVLTRSRSFALALVDTKTSELRHQALHDALTGLPNRTLILDRTDHALARARADGTSVALLFIDLDGFKDVNDANGHGVGDFLLRVVGERLAGTLGEADTVGRLGGDEFVVLAEGRSAEMPELLADRLLASCEAPIHIESMHGVVLPISASIGIATGARESAEELLRDADIALYQAKTAGKNQYAVFEPEMHVAVRLRVDLGNELNAALASGQFFLVYQPIVSLETMHVTGVEALVRWQHPTRGVLHPVDFISALESSGLIVDVGKFVMGEACRQTKIWHDSDLPVCVSINVSARQLESDALVLDIQRAIAEAGLDPRSVVVEMTETALMRDAESVARRLRRLKGVGARIAIDDFGTGYSSLAYLHQFPVDSLKIDRSFIEAMTVGPEGIALVHATVQLGKALSLETLAEGIEEESQLELLRLEGCDTGQGYLIARPLNARDMEQFLASHVVVPRGKRISTETGTEAVNAPSSAPTS